MHSLKECSIKPIDGKIEQDIMHWQSDYLIVSKKSLNRDREKGVAVMPREVRDTSAIRRDGEQMATKLTALTSRARKDPNCKFTSLAHLLNEEYLRECFWGLKRDKASGIDGVEGCIAEEPCAGNPQARFCEGH